MPSRLILRLLVVFTRKLEILVTTLGTKKGIECVCINGMSRLRSFNLEKTFFPQGQSKVSIIIRFLY